MIVNDSRASRQQGQWQKEWQLSIPRPFNDWTWMTLRSVLALFILWNGSNYSNHCNPAVLYVPNRMYMIICKMQRYFGYNFRMLWITSSACLLQLFPWVNHEWLHSCMCRTSWFRSQEGFQRKVNSWLQPSVLPELLLDDKHMTYLSKGF